MVNIKFDDFLRTTEYYQTKEMKLNHKIGDKKFEDKNGTTNI